MRMDVLARIHRRGKHPYRPAKLPHGLPRRHVPERNLVTVRDLPPHLDLAASKLQPFSRGERAQRYRYVVPRIEMKHGACAWGRVDEIGLCHVVTGVIYLLRDGRASAAALSLQPPVG